MLKGFLYLLNNYINSKYYRIIRIKILTCIFFLIAILPDPVYCPNNCGSRYKGEKRKGNLTRHLKHECGVEKNFPCIYCQRKFSQKSTLKTHSALVHKVIIA